jgi:hypothetical protein
MANRRTPSRNDDKVLRYGIRTSSRYVRPKGSVEIEIPNQGTYISISTRFIQLTPSKLRFLTFSKAKHAQLLANPLGDIFDELNVEGLATGIYVYICP